MKIELSQVIDKDHEIFVNFFWIDNQIGFGNVNMYEGKEGKKIWTEYMGKEFVKKLLCDWVDQAELKE